MFNPFENYQNYHGTHYHKFNQDKHLNKDEKGFCFSLCLHWLKSFYSSESSYLGQKKTFWETDDFDDSIRKIKAYQATASFSDWRYSWAFRLEVNEHLKKFGFATQLELNSKQHVSGIEEPTIKDFLFGTVQENATAVIFLKKSNEETGHAICIASKTNGYDIRISVLDPNYGEIVFNYSPLDYNTDISRKQAYVEYPYQDCYLPQRIKTFDNFLVDLMQFYQYEQHYEHYKILYYQPNEALTLSSNQTYAQEVCARLISSHQTYKNIPPNSPTKRKHTTNPHLFLAPPPMPTQPITTTAAISETEPEISLLSKIQKNS